MEPFLSARPATAGMSATPRGRAERQPRLWNRGVSNPILRASRQHWTRGRGGMADAADL